MLCCCFFLTLSLCVSQFGSHCCTIFKLNSLGVLGGMGEMGAGFGDNCGLEFTITAWGNSFLETGCKSVLLCGEILPCVPLPLYILSLLLLLLCFIFFPFCCFIELFLFQPMSFSFCFLILLPIPPGAGER